MHIFNTKDTIASLPYKELIIAIKNMFIEQYTIPLRHIHPLDSQDSDASLLIMPAWQTDYLGVKHVLIYPNNAKRHQKQGLYSTYNLYDNDSGEPLAIMDGNVITCRRTAAASALAADYLARPDATKLLIVGAGNVAREIAYAYAAVRNIKQVQIWNPTHARAEALAQILVDDGFDAHAVTDLEEAVQNNDIVSCATLSNKPLILRRWVQPGTHIDLIGSFRPNMRESDSDLFEDTSVFIDTSEALIKSGDLLEAINDGKLKKENIIADLADLCNLRHVGRKNKEEITIFKAVGSAGEDLAAAILIYESQAKSL
ncbi:ornithine cyclodeaminase family protein [Oligella urethralis]|uniref:ornithine cyclodeaminase family protein n=1 Tax=Oligella urethralis TaxID=90245 RepID=UPI00065FC1A4|nr:ornithine cyclodeaminase family protein [Oligella urethralis]